MKKSLMPLVLLTASALALATVAPAVTIFAEEEATEESVESVEETEEAAEDSEEEVAEEASGLVLKHGYGAPHGARSFGTASVLVDGDTIVSAYIDEYQFLDPEAAEGVPNSDAGFGDGFAEGVVLASKVVNDEMYSGMMAENAGATLTLGEGYAAIQDFVAGKTIAEVEAAIAELNELGEEGSVADVVSGSTLVDTAGYLQLIVDVANDGFEFSVAGEASELKQVLGAPHGARSFAITTVAVDGDTVVAAAIDEFQFLDPETAEGVPNSDGGFADGYAEGVVLASKLVNNELYSNMMAENAGSTVTFYDNLKALTDFATGKTVAELEEAIAELGELGEEGSVADVVSGATLVDAAGYLQTIVDAANN